MTVSQDPIPGTVRQTGRRVYGGGHGSHTMLAACDQPVITISEQHLW